MIRKSFSTLVPFLIFGLVLSAYPTQAWAKKKSLAVLPVKGTKVSDRQLFQMKDLLNQALAQHAKVKVVEDEAVAEYFVQDALKTPDKTPGDELLSEAKQHYLQFQNKLALKTLDKAVEALQDEPGVAGGLFHSHLLRAQIESEQGQSSKARKSLIKAVRLNFQQSKVKDNFYTPRLRQMFAAVHKAEKKKTEFSKLTVQVSGGDARTPVYLNGLQTAKGKEVVLEIVKDEPTYLQAGQAGRLYKLLAKKDEHRLRIRYKSTRKSRSNNRFHYPRAMKK